MYLRELITQAALYLPTRYNQKMVEDVIFAVFRAAIEELMLNPADADISIQGIGRFYCNRKYVDALRLKVGKEEKDKVKLYWVIKFKPALPLKRLFNGTVDPINYRICNRYLYPEYHEGEIVGAGVGKKVVKAPEIMHSNKYWIDKIRDLQKGKLRLTENGTLVKVPPVTRPKVDKRGRPLKRMTPDGIRDEVMRQLYRDLKRELRYLREGKITEADLDLAKYGCKDEIQLIKDMKEAEAKGEPFNYYHRRRKRKLNTKRKKKSEQVREQITGCSVGEERKSEETS